MKELSEILAVLSIATAEGTNRQNMGKTVKVKLPASLICGDVFCATFSSVDTNVLMLILSWIKQLYFYYNKSKEYCY